MNIFMYNIFEYIEYIQVQKLPCNVTGLQKPKSEENRGFGGHISDNFNPILKTRTVL